MSASSGGCLYSSLASCRMSHWRIGAKDAVEHLVTPCTAAPADAAHDAFWAEPGLLQGLLLGDVAGLGGCLDPVYGGVGEQVAHQQPVRLGAVAVATGFGQQPN